MPENRIIFDDVVYNDPVWNIPAKPRNLKAKKYPMLRQFPVLGMKEKVYEFFQTGLQSDKPADNFVGIEIENETRYAFELPFIPGWSRHREGSLRDFGFEYVSHAPVKYNDVRDHLKSLFSSLDLAKGAYKLSNSNRTSTHVHLDASHMTYGNVITTAIVYWMLEDWLSNFCGETRKGNLFCIRSSDSLSVQGVIARSLQRLDPFPHELVGEDVRYGSLNFSSLPKFGSLESRLMRGVDNADEAMLWVSVLQRIKNFALQFSNPIAFKKKFEQDYPAVDFPTIVLGDLAQVISTHLPKGFNIQQSIRQGFLSCSAIFGARPVWNFDKEIAEAEAAQKEEIERQKKYEAAQKIAQKTKKEILEQAMQRAAGLIIPDNPIEDFAINDNDDQLDIGYEFEGDNVEEL